MGKRFRKGSMAASTSGGDGGLSDQELKALADKTSFSLENVTDFHEVKNLAQLLLTSYRKLDFLSFIGSLNKSMIRYFMHSVS